MVNHPPPRFALSPCSWPPHSPPGRFLRATRQAPGSLRAFRQPESSPGMSGADTRKTILHVGCGRAPLPVSRPGNGARFATTSTRTWSRTSSVPSPTCPPWPTVAWTRSSPATTWNACPPMKCPAPWRSSAACCGRAGWRGFWCPTSRAWPSASPPATWSASCISPRPAPSPCWTCSGDTAPPWPPAGTTWPTAAASPTPPWDAIWPRRDSGRCVWNATPRPTSCSPPPWCPSRRSLPSGCSRTAAAITARGAGPRRRPATGGWWRGSPRSGRPTWNWGWCAI